MCLNKIMGSSWKVVIALLLVGAAGMALFYYYSKPDLQKDTVLENRQLTADSLDRTLNQPTPTTDPTNVVAPAQIGTENVVAGVFVSANNGEINYSQGLQTYKLPLAVQNVSVMCTTQGLEGIKELDFNMIEDVIISTPSDVGTHIPQGTSVVIFADLVDEVLRAHTIAVAADACTK